MCNCQKHGAIKNAILVSDQKSLNKLWIFKLVCNLNFDQQMGAANDIYWLKYCFFTVLLQNKQKMAKCMKNTFVTS